MDYKRIIGDLDVLISVNEAVGDFLFVELEEKQFERALSYKKTDLIDTPILKIIHREDRKKFNRFINNKEYKQKNIETRLKDKAGNIHWFLIKSRDYEKEKNKALVLIIMQEISKEKRLEVQLEKSEKIIKNFTEEVPEIQFWKIFTPKKVEIAIDESLKMLKTVINNIPQRIFWKDNNLRYLGCNKSYAKSIGYESVKSIIGKKDEDIFENKEIIQKFKQNQKLVLKSGQPQYHKIEEFTLKKKNRIFDVNRIPLMSGTNKIQGLLVSFEDITESIKTKRELRKEQEIVKRIMETSPSGIIWVNKEGKLTFANSRAQEVLRLEKEELTNRLYNDKKWKITDYEGNEFPDSQLPFQIVSKTLKPVFNVRHAIQSLKGEMVPLEINAAPFFDEEGNFNGMVASVRDISEDLESKRKLEESEKKYRDLVDLLPEVIYEADRDLNLTYVNSIGFKKFKYSRKDFEEGLNVIQMISPEYRDVAKRRIKKIFQGEITEPQEYKMLRKDGTSFYARIHSRPTFNEKGEIYGIRGIINDITERKVAEQRVKESEKKYRHLFENSPNMICLLDSKGTIIDLNKTLANALEFKKEDLYGKKYFEAPLFNKIHIPNTEQLLREIVRNGSIESFEFKYEKSDKKNIWIRLDASLIKTDSMDLIIAIMQDITDQKNYEKMLVLNEKRLNSLQKINQIIDYPEKEIVRETLKAALDLTKSKIATLILRNRNKSSYQVYFFNPIDKMDLMIKEKVNLDSDSPLIDSMRQRKGIIKNEKQESHVCIFSKAETDINITKYMITPVLDSEESVCSVCVANKKRNYTELDSNQISLLIEGFWRNIQRKRAKLALKKSEENYRNLLETSAVGVMEVDQKTQEITYMNPKVAEITGLDKKDLKNMDDFIQLIHSDDMHKYVNNPNAVSFEYRIISNDQEIKWISGTRIERYSEKGDIESFRIWIQDITDKKLYENLVYELNVSFLKFTTDIRKNMVMLLETCAKLMNGELSMYINRKQMEDGEEFKILDSNGDEYTYSGVEFREKLFVSEFFKESHDFPQIHEDIDLTTYQNTDPFLKEHRIKSCYGKLIRSKDKYENGVCIFFNENRKTSHKKFLILFLISDALEIENNRWNMQQHLERQNKMLEEMNMLKSDLLSRTSHELKTPLISIKGFTELLLTIHKSKFNSEVISILEEIKKGSRRLEEIINTLLKSSKLDRDDLKLNMALEDLSFLIRYTVKELRGMANLRDQEIKLAIHNSLKAKFDKERIHEVLSNLIVNAVKYTPPGGEILIKTEKREEEYVVSVKDTGVGFTEEEKSKLFTQFGKIERYGQGWDLGIEGSGLGLYIAKKIIELHGGKIWAESKGRNKGSTFFFSLPIE